MTKLYFLHDEECGWDNPPECKCVLDCPKEDILTASADLESVFHGVDPYLERWEGDPEGADLDDVLTFRSAAETAAFRKKKGSRESSRSG